jgi:hypothetical protein
LCHQEGEASFMSFLRRRAQLPAWLFLASLLAIFLLASAPAYAWTSTKNFNQPGNVLISDQFNNRVIEVDRDKNPVWSFGSGDPKDCSPTAGHILGLNDAERLPGGLTLLAGTGTPGCPDNRVIVVNPQGNIIWQYGQGGKSGRGFNLLNVPVFAIQLPYGNFLITDQGNNRIIEVEPRSKAVVWSYGPTSGLGALNSPNSAELLPNRNILIADENNNRVIEINRAGQIVWQFNSGLSGAAFASRLPNGNTLITDSNHSRIIEVTPSKQIVFEYKTNTQPGSNSMPQPTNAVQLSNGDISIAYQFNQRALIIDRNKNIVFQYGTLNKAGNGPNQLNGPYTAFVIGDYTGQTPPPSNFSWYVASQQLPYTRLLVQARPPADQRINCQAQKLPLFPLDKSGLDEV